MKKVLITLLAVVLLVSSSAAAVSAAPSSNAGKPAAEIDKIVFVHYPKVNAQGSEPYWSPPNAPAPTDENTRYKYTNFRWAVPEVEYEVNPSGAGAPDGAENGIKAAFDTWEAASGVMDFECLSESSSETSLDDSQPDGTNVVSWEDITAKHPGAIAVAIVWYYTGSKEIIEVDTMMNSTLQWSLNDGFMGDPNIDLGDTEAYDVQNIMTHEAGHWLMLEDLYQWKTQKLTMYGYGAKGELQKRTLGEGDELGIEGIY
ncbi:hypothetical protein ACFLVC_05340 [Chloroflexota bacterium]